MNIFQTFVACSLIVWCLAPPLLAQVTANGEATSNTEASELPKHDAHSEMPFWTRCIGWAVLGLFGAGGFGAYMRRRPTSLVLCAILVFAVFRAFASWNLSVSIIPPLICIAITFLLGSTAKTAANEAVSEGRYMEAPYRFRSRDTLSFAYILASIVLFISIWLESGWWQFTPNAPEWTTGRKIVLSGIVLGGMPFAMWIDTVVYGGVAVLRTVPIMALIFLRCRRGRTLVAILVFCICFWHSPYSKEPQPYRWEMTYSLVSAVLLLWLQPPYTLMLGASSHETGNALAKLSNALFPFRVVALLDHSRVGRFRGTFSILTDDLRTVDKSFWRVVVDSLIDLVPLVVLDARTNTPPVEYEAGEILRLPMRLRRTVFIVGDGGGAPALVSHGKSIKSPGIVATQEKDIEATLSFENVGR